MFSVYEKLPWKEVSPEVVARGVKWRIARPNINENICSNDTYIGDIFPTTGLWAKDGSFSEKTLNWIEPRKKFSLISEKNNKFRGWKVRHNFFAVKKARKCIVKHASFLMRTRRLVQRESTSLYLKGLEWNILSISLIQNDLWSWNWKLYHSLTLGIFRVSYYTGH